MVDEKEIPGPTKRPRLSSERAGLSFPVDRIARSLKECTFFDKIGYAGPIYLAAVLEYLSAEVLELAGHKAINDQMIRIVPRHVRYSICNDSELLRVLYMCGLPSPTNTDSLLYSNTASSSCTKNEDKE